MASNCLTSVHVLGTVSRDVRAQRRHYSNVKFVIVSKLCGGIALEQHFLNRHKKVMLKLGGPKEELIVEANFYCNVSATSVEPPHLFKNLESAHKPIAMKF